MSLKIYFEKENLGYKYAGVKIPLYEEHMEKQFDLKNELRGIKTFGLIDNLVYEKAPAEIKTYLSVKYNPDRIYDVSLCSPEMVLKLLSLKDGMIYAPYLAMNYTFIKSMASVKVDAEIAVNRSGFMVKANTLEQILRAKKRTSEIFQYDEDNEFVSTLTSYASDELAINEVCLGSTVGEALGRGEKNVIVRVKFLYNKPILLVGNTGDIAHSLIISALANSESFNECNEKIELNTVDMLALNEDYKDIMSRSLMLGCDNIFTMLYHKTSPHLMIFDNLDVVIRENEELYHQLLDFVDEETCAQFVFISRLISNAFTTEDSVRLAKTNIRRANNCICVTIS